MSGKRSAVFWFVLLALAPFAAEAQSCLDPAICDPYTSLCSRSCQGCLLDYPDYYCPQNEAYSTTCGQQGNPCVEDGCTPNWVTQSSTQVGAWKSCWGVGCFYYHSFNIYECDSNQCNVNANFYCRTRCVSQQKGWYAGSCNCCSIFSNLGGCWGITCPVG